MTAQEFLRKSVELKGRVASSGDLHTEVITEAQASNKFWVDPETGYRASLKRLQLYGRIK